VRTISSTAKKEIFASQTGAAFLSVLQISHSQINTIYLVNNMEDVVYDGNTYTAYAFKFEPPKDKEGGVQNSRLVLPNVDRTILTAIRSLTSALTVSAAVIMIMPNGTGSKEAGWWDFDLKNISYDALTISGDLIYSLELRNNISMVKYNNITFPGLYA
jgi:hypothetical protein